ncbi:glycosyltransferase [Sulfitobacter sp. D35]|uniref:glycosyltransferase n=1 Tax=Sulfitobacter sp. D35 TaxID=3083252 RepID=UPI00296F3B6A|nr:glycosyltransferase [Sulfitobacter sp. D35]MDW4498006.1 glycosyltransferase [Sulfitobacter sp. D35]
MPTGIDRVERAYLQHLSEDGVPLWALARSAWGFLLLDPSGVRAAIPHLCGASPWPGGDLLSSLALRRPAAVRRTEAGLRRLAVARCRPGGLKAMLSRHLPTGSVYVNVGHTNLDAPVLEAIAAARGRCAVMVHDMIPLDHPAYQRDGSVARFRVRMRLVSERADVVIYTARATRQQAEHRFESWGRVPPGVTAWLGVEIGPVGDLPSDLPPASPYFICVGTLEPRKNIGFLLNLWGDLGPGAPALLLCGARGWKNEDVFRRLDGSRTGSIREIAGLDDAALRRLVSGAAALLFPSHAEGFGLPVMEAAALGTPVICNDLPVLREVMGDVPTYLPVIDRHRWAAAIRALATGQGDGPPPVFDPPRWDRHFQQVLSVI